MMWDRLRLQVGLWWGLSLGGYLLLWWQMSLRNSWGLSRGLHSFIPYLGLGIGYVVFVAILYGCYWRLAQLIRYGRWRPSVPLSFGLSVLWAIPTIFVYPFNANDIFRYALRGRIFGIYGANPYTDPPNLFPNDFFLPLAGEWEGATTPYGPVWELVASGIASLIPDSPYYHILLLKLISLVAFWGVGWLIWLGLREKSPEMRLWYTFLWWGNPALLLTFGVDGHNDSLMMLWLVLGWWIWRQGATCHDRWWMWGGLTVMWLGVLTKVIALLALPFFALMSWRVLDQWRQRLIFAAGTAVSWVALAILTFAPFGSINMYIGRLAEEATGGASFSPAALTILSWRAVTGSSIDRVLLGRFFIGSFILVALVLMAWTWWGDRRPERGATDLFFAYTIQAFSFRLWYTTWLFPYVLLDGVNGNQDVAHELRLHISLWFLFFGQIVVFVFSHLWYTFGNQHLWTHAIGVPFVFVGSLLCGWLSWWVDTGRYGTNP